MVLEEIYVLTKHGKFTAEYIESIPIYKRRYYLHLMEQEADAIKKEQERIERKSKVKYRPSKV